jgi:alpha-tubulin suppressor-like RCC1 family protein
LISLSGSHDPEPKLISTLAGITITDIACGEHHCLALDSNGDIYSWGTPTS